METYETYRDGLARSLAPLAPREQYFFGCWCVEQLSGIFSVEEVKKLSAADLAQINHAMEFMWNSYAGFSNINERGLYDAFEAVQQLDQKDFDQDKFPEYTAQALLVAQQLVLSFLEEQDVELILDTAETLIQVMEFSISHNYAHDTTDLFNHPLVRNELRLQQQLIERLSSGPALTTADKWLFRANKKNE
ncbi:hypothetical protein [Chitinophaga sp. 22620]|uniref:hypothetical protein n=1 Tax=Chitinophaga sp. 22620 TaxID=3453952 RepID=UPI003F84EAED